MNRAIKRGIWLFGFALFFLAGFSNADTTVRDHIRQNTTWTKAESPYLIYGDLMIAKGAVLTIEPGVEVRFAATRGGRVTGATTANTDLIVLGGLRAVGTQAEPITFTSLKSGERWGAVYFSGSDSANAILQHCMIKGGKVVVNHASPTITGCAIFGGQSGVEIVANAAPRIYNNRIAANGVGIVLWSPTAQPVISRNEIYRNQYGIYARNFGQVRITGNRIYGNLRYNVVNMSASSLELPQNDFRQADPVQVAKTIYDGYDNPNFGKVNFLPYTGMPADAATQLAKLTPGAVQGEQPKLEQEEDLFAYGRPFDSMKVGNIEKERKSSSSTMKALAVGATAVATAVFFLL